MFAIVSESMQLKRLKENVPTALATPATEGLLPPILGHASHEKEKRWASSSRILSASSKSEHSVAHRRRDARCSTAIQSSTSQTNGKVSASCAMLRLSLFSAQALHPLTLLSRSKRAPSCSSGDELTRTPIFFRTEGAESFATPPASRRQRRGRHDEKEMHERGKGPAMRRRNEVMCANSDRHRLLAFAFLDIHRMSIRDGMHPSRKLRNPPGSALYQHYASSAGCPPA